MDTYKHIYIHACINMLTNLSGSCHELNLTVEQWTGRELCNNVQCMLPNQHLSITVRDATTPSHLVKDGDSTL